MLNKLRHWEISGFIFVVIFGTMLHFFYKWTGNNLIAGFFSPVNESIWEHLKLLFFPALLFSIVEYFVIGKNYKNFITSKSFGIMLGVLAIIATICTYQGIIGKDFLLADILVFVFGVGVTYVYSWMKLNKAQGSKKAQSIGLILIMLLGMSFIWFTMYPPHIALFFDPIAKKYGI